MKNGICVGAIAPALVGLSALASQSLAGVGLELRPSLQTANVGDTVTFGIYAVADAGVPQALSAVQVVLAWEPAYLQMLSNSNAGAVSLLSSAFTSPDPYGLNESLLPQDGNALYLAYAGLGTPVQATPAGVLLTTFRFQTLSPVSFTPVSLLTSGGSPVGFSTVFDGTVPNLDVTGALSGGGVQIVPAPGALGLAAIGLLAGARRRRR
ncbi:MAG TPA: hypothetical protein VD997_01065 [Phycisphaerales bacterium]|nr:hypothetical protein [Phycisphaerales bacterium]